MQLPDAVPHRQRVGPGEFGHALCLLGSHRGLAPSARQALEDPTDSSCIPEFRGSRGLLFRFFQRAEPQSSSGDLSGPPGLAGLGSQTA